MIKLGDIIRKRVIPNSKEQGATPTLFEIDLETRLLAVRDSGCSCLIVSLLPYHDPEGHEYAFLGIPNGIDPWRILDRLHKPVIVLQIGKPFSEQWPHQLIGCVKHPRDLEDNPVIAIPDYRNVPGVYRISDFRPA